MPADVAGVRDEPTLELEADGGIRSANQAAIELLGMGLEDLRALAPGALSAEPTPPEETAALLEQWKTAGDAALVGFTTIKRPDGALLRVAFAIVHQDDGSLLATLNSVPGSKAVEARVYSVGDVLGQWRAAERQLETLTIGSPAYEAVREEVESLRGQYRRLFEARQQAS